MNPCWWEGYPGVRGVTPKGLAAMAAIPDVERFRARLLAEIQRWNREHPWGVASW